MSKSDGPYCGQLHHAQLLVNRLEGYKEERKQVIADFSTLERWAVCRLDLDGSHLEEFTSQFMVNEDDDGDKEKWELYLEWFQGLADEYEEALHDATKISYRATIFKGSNPYDVILRSQVYDTSDEAEEAVMTEYREKGNTETVLNWNNMLITSYDNITFIRIIAVADE